jgi:hypothetical protein
MNNKIEPIASDIINVINNDAGFFKPQYQRHTDFAIEKINKSKVTPVVVSHMICNMPGGYKECKNPNNCPFKLDKKLLGSACTFNTSSS